MKKYLTILLIFLSAALMGAPLLLEKNSALDANALRAVSHSDLIVMRNSIFARYGYVFKSGALRDYFSAFSWYLPNAGFSFNALSKTDQRNVNLILAEEKKRAEGLKNGLYGRNFAVRKYFLSVRPKERIPAGTEAAIRAFWKKVLSADVFTSLKVPVLLAPETGDEKDEAFIRDRVAKCGDRFDYWEASLDAKGVVRVLKSCSCEPGWSTACGDIYYFDEEGRVLLVEGGLRGTTANYQYYYQYCLGRVVWIEVTSVCGSAGVPDKMEKFFY